MKKKKDTASFTAMNGKGIAVLPFWRHEFEVQRHKEQTKKLTIALSVATATIAILTFRIVKH